MSAGTQSPPRGNQQNGDNLPAHRPPPQLLALKKYLDARTPELAKAIDAQMSEERLVRLALTAATKTPALAGCTPASVYLSLLTASQLGLEPNGRDAHLVPFGSTCQLVPDFKGLIRLAYRSPDVQSFDARAVYENDEFDYGFGSESFLRHKPVDGERGALKYAYAIVKTRNGGSPFVVMNREEVLKRKNFSKSSGGKDSPWQKWEPEMWAKTAAKGLSKFAPLGDAFRAAVEHDDAMESQGVTLSTGVSKRASLSPLNDRMGDGGNIIDIPHDDFTSVQQDREPGDDLPAHETETHPPEDMGESAAYQYIGQLLENAKTLDNVVVAEQEAKNKARAGEMIGDEYDRLSLQIASKRSQVAADQRKKSGRLVD
jgi:recombination protein RecT